MDKVTICTSWDGKDYYPAEYVERLYRSVYRNTSVPFDFVLFAGPDVKDGQFGEDIFVVQTGKSYWWPGMFFWMKNPPGVQTRTKLYIEIDVVIVGSLDTLINWPSNHCYSRDWQGDTMPKGQENEVNPGVSLIRDGADSYVWDEYVKAGMPDWNPKQKTKDIKSLRMAAQGIINDKQRGYDLFPETVCSSYKYKVRKEGLSKDCITVHFHGAPLQDDVNDYWVKEHWR
jgi:hypothetical protein